MVDTRKSLREMTRVELEELAKERGLPARTRLGKRELIARLEQWEGRPQDEYSRWRAMSLHQLLAIAKEKKISRKWRMRKDELIAAILRARLQEEDHIRDEAAEEGPVAEAGNGSVLAADLAKLLEEGTDVPLSVPSRQLHSLR